MGLVRHIGLICAMALLPALAQPVFAAEELTPNDPGFSQQWYLNTIQAPQAWAIGRALRGSLGQGSPDVVIAVIDTGVDINHPDLKNNIWTNPDEIPGNGLDDDQNGYIDDVHGWNFISGTNDPRPSLDQTGDLERSPLGVHHGTILAGLAAAVGNNQEGLTGVSWTGSVMPLRAIQSDGSGAAKYVVKAMEYAIDNGAKIINLSFVGNINTPALERVIYRARDADILVIASAGNQIKRADGTNEVFNLDATPLYPICNDGVVNAVIGVTSTDRNDKKSEFASFGSRCIDIAAPGQDLIVARSTNSAFGSVRAYGFPIEGTSMSTALVSGAAALLKTLFPTASMRQIGEKIIAGADTIDAQNSELAGKLGAGRLNIVRSIELLQTELPQSSPSIADERSAQEVHVPSSPVRIARQSGKSLTVFTYEANGQLLGSVSLSNPWSSMPSIARLQNGSWVLGSPQGVEPSVLILDASGNVMERLTPFPKGYRGGITVVVVGSSIEERIAAIPRERAGANIKIYSTGGSLLVDQFFFPKTIRDNWVAGPWVLEKGRQAVRIRSATGDRQAVIVDGTQVRTVSNGSLAGARQNVLSTWGSQRRRPEITLDGLRSMSGLMLNGQLVSAYPRSFALNVLVVGIDNGQEDILTIPRWGAGHVRLFTRAGVPIREWFIGTSSDRANWQVVFALPS